MVSSLGYHYLQIIVAITVLWVIDESAGQNYYNNLADEELNAISLSPNTRKVTGSRQLYVYTFSPSSTRNFNSGARYYLRHVPKETLSSSEGYSFYRQSTYYASSYGYRLKNAPVTYRTVTMGPTWVYYPPMFQYYHFGRSWYWRGQTARYVCRNELAYWPLENQTHVFVDGLAPAVTLSDFEETIPDPPNNDMRYNLPSPRAHYESDLTELNSMEINLNGRNASSRLFRRRSTVAPAAAVARGEKRSSSAVYEVKTYAHFACPDGRDPDEIYCCGPSNAQHCCLDVNEDKFIPRIFPSLSSNQIIAIVCLPTAVLINVALYVYRCKREKCFCFSENDSTDSFSTRSAQVESVQADTDDTDTSVSAPASSPPAYSSYFQTYLSPSASSMSDVPLCPSRGLTLSIASNSGNRASPAALATAGSGDGDAGGVATTSLTSLQPQPPVFDAAGIPTPPPTYSSLFGTA